ncbi:MAG: S-layer homology domain-containing protein, partial [Oscillospiraceae bacterium]|nr:S-layer homology domain-containing protein [Oscillospiraceae bacterium]
IENPYSDINTNQWYYDGAIWAYENGLEKGEDGMFNAATPCNRGYVVTYLYRFVTGNELDE